MIVSIVIGRLAIVLDVIGTWYACMPVIATHERPRGLYLGGHCW